MGRADTPIRMENPVHMMHGLPAEIYSCGYAVQTVGRVQGFKLEWICCEWSLGLVEACSSAAFLSFWIVWVPGSNPGTPTDQCRRWPRGWVRFIVSMTIFLKTILFFIYYSQTSSHFLKLPRVLLLLHITPYVFSFIFLLLLSHPHPSNFHPNLHAIQVSDVHFHFLDGTLPTAYPNFPLPLAPPPSNILYVHTSHNHY